MKQRGTNEETMKRDQTRFKMACLKSNRLLTFSLITKKQKGNTITIKITIKFYSYHVENTSILSNTNCFYIEELVGF